jgi:hypothetical protein
MAAPSGRREASAHPALHTLTFLLSGTARAFDDNGRTKRGAIILSLLFDFAIVWFCCYYPWESHSLALRPNIKVLRDYA